MAGALALLLACPAPALAAPLPDTEAQAAVTAARVAALTADYRRHSAAAAAAAADLAAGYALIAAADEAADGSDRQAEAARSARATRTLELYAFGAGSHSSLTLLTADSPEDGLWRLSVGAALGNRLLADVTRRSEAAAATAAADDARATSAEEAGLRLARVLGRLRDSEAAARQSLETARVELARLTEAARRERAARAAAEELRRAEDAAAAARLAAGTPVTALGIPAAYETAYRGAAGTCPGLDWTLLAAVGQIESGHGRNNGPSSAGAIGPMQFMPGTFAAYGVDGDGDGTKSAWDPQDAVFSAARYLCANGAGHGASGVQRALLAYNHAQWYVDLVLRAQSAVAARG